MASRSRKQKKVIPFLLLLPLVIWLFCFAIIPLGYGFWLSFHEARIINLSNPTWTGLTNYINLFKAIPFQSSLRWSLVFAVISVSIEMLLGLAISQLFNRNFPLKGVAITLFLLPMVVSPFLMGTMFRLLFNEFVGPIAYLLAGITGTTAMLGAAWVNPTLIGADAINRTPSVFLNIYSALQGVSQELLEAAKVDGANAWQRLTRVSLPLIMPIMGITFLERVLASFLIFDLVFALTAGGPGTMTQGVSIFIYRRAFERSDFGMANAASFTIAVMLLIPSIYLVKRMMRTLR